MKHFFPPFLLAFAFFLSTYGREITPSDLMPGPRRLGGALLDVYYHTPKDKDRMGGERDVAIIPPESLL